MFLYHKVKQEYLKNTVHIYIAKESMLASLQVVKAKIYRWYKSILCLRA